MSMPRRVICVLLLLLLTSLPGLAQPPLEPRTPADSFVRAGLPPETPVESIVIKFHEGTNVRLREGILTALPRDERQETRLQELKLTAEGVQADIDLLHALLASTPEVAGLRRHFSAGEEELAAFRASGEARSGRELADLDLYFRVEVQPDLVQGDVKDLVDALNALDSIEIATGEPPSEPASDIFPPTPSYEAQQGYLDPASAGGIDARYSWTFPGGKGAGVKVIDIESGWRPTHEDMPPLFHQGGPSPVSGTAGIDHGTACVGLIAAPANGYGVTGIAHQVQVGTQRVHSISGYTADEAILDAALLLDAGDAIQIELHKPGSQTPNSPCPCAPFAGTCDFVPMEIASVTWDAIHTATANGIIVVEPAGNGATDLDDPVYGGWFSPSHDSGAIVVGAGNSGTDRSPTCFTTYGSRVDVHAWGWDVVTLGDGDLFDGDGDPNQYYTAVFDGTSAATPIVTGAVLDLQGVAYAHGLPAFTPSEMRQWLKDTGTPQVASVKHVGPQPNLRAAINALMEADLSVTVTATDCEVIATVTNDGPSPEPAASLTMTFGSGSVFWYVPDAAASSCEGQEVGPHTGQLEELLCELGSIPSGGSVTLTWEVVNGLAPINIDGEVSGEAEDSDLNNNEDDAVASGCSES